MRVLLIVLMVFFTALTGQARAQTPSAAELAQVNQQLAILAKAFKDKAPASLDAHLSPGFKVSGFEGDIARKVLAAAVAQVNDARLEGAVITKTAQGYSVALTSREGAPPRDLKLDAAFLFTEINLFSASVKKPDSLKTKLLQPERASASFELHYGLIVLKDVQLNGAQANFVLDSGAPVMVLNSGPLAPAPVGAVQGGAQGINGAAQLDVVALKSFKWQGFELGAAELLATDLTAIEQRLGFKVHGLVGYELLKDYELVIDYAASRLELHRPPAASGSLPSSLAAASPSLLQGRTPRLVVPFELRGHLPVVSASIVDLADIGATPLRLALDTGASANLLDSAVFTRLPSTAYADLSTTQLKGVGAGAGTQAPVFTLNALTLNGTNFAKMKTASRSVAHLNAKLGATPIDGILGYELLSKSLVAINYPERQLKFY